MNNEEFISKIARIKPNPAYNVVIGEECAQSIAKMQQEHYDEQLSIQREALLLKVIKQAQAYKYDVSKAVNKPAELRMETANAKLDALIEVVEGWVRVG